MSDELLKGAIEETFIDFLRFVYPEADTTFDFSTELVFLQKEGFEFLTRWDDPDDPRKAGLLVKAHLLNGTVKWIWLHTEQEAEEYPHLHFTYFNVIID